MSCWYQADHPPNATDSTSGNATAAAPDESEWDEPEPEGWTPGSYWLPVFFGRGHRKSRKGKKGGRYSLPVKGSGMRPKGGKAGKCHHCGQEGHWKNECPQRKGGKNSGGHPFTTTRSNDSAKGGQGRGKGGGNPGIFGRGKGAYFFMLLGLFCLGAAQQIGEQEGLSGFEEVCASPTEWCSSFMSWNETLAVPEPTLDSSSVLSYMDVHEPQFFDAIDIDTTFNATDEFYDCADGGPTEDFGVADSNNSYRMCCSNEHSFELSDAPDTVGSFPLTVNRDNDHQLSTVPPVTDVFMLSNRHLVFRATPGRRFLVLDCGAGANLAGEISLMNFDSEFLSKVSEAIAYGESTQEFSGISKEPIQAKFEAWAPTFLGGIGKNCYRCHVLPGSMLPLLLSTPSMRTAKFLLRFKDNCVYLPDAACDQEDVFLRCDLDYDGMHYRLPIDNVDQNVSPKRYRITFDELVPGKEQRVLLACPFETTSVGVQTGESGESVPVHFEGYSTQQKYRNLFRECSVALLTGTTPPKLNRTESDLFMKRQAERETLRPTGPAPELLAELDHDTWDFWEFFAGKAYLTTAVERHEMTCGPPITWENGWDLSNDEHWSKIKHWLLNKRVRVLWASPDVISWTIEGEKMMLSDQKALDRMYEACEIYSSKGGHFLVEAPHRSEFFLTEVAEKLRSLPHFQFMFILQLLVINELKMPAIHLRTIP